MCVLCLNPDIAPVVHPPHKLPVALRETVKTELDTMAAKPVTEPTKRVSSMVVV